MKIDKYQLVSCYFAVTMLVLIVSMACGRNPIPTRSIGTPQCEVTDITGEVEIFHSSSSEIQMVTDTTTVQCGDEVKSKSGTADLVCDGRDKKTLVAGFTLQVSCSSRGTQIAVCDEDNGCAFGPPPTFTPLPTLPPPIVSCELTNVTGEVEIFPSFSVTSQSYSPTIVYCGDEIRPISGSAELICTGLEPKFLVSGITEQVNCTLDGTPVASCFAEHGCSLYSGGFDTDEGIVGIERAGIEIIPYIIEPRATYLLDQPTILRWNEVEGAYEYEVAIYNIDYEWSTTTTESEVLYDGEPLERGVEYNFVVTTIVEDENGEAFRVSSQDENINGLGFTLLSAWDADEFQQDFWAIPQAAPFLLERTIAEYNLYRGYGLNSAAIQLLERTVEFGETDPNLLLLMGQAYQNVALYTEAEVAYLAVLDEATGVNDLNIFGQSSAALGRLLCRADDADRIRDGVEHLETAVSIYQQMDNEREVNRLNEELARCQLSEN